MEVHDKPDESICDATTQWPLDKLKWILNYLNIPTKQHKSIEIAIPCRLKSTRLKKKPLIKIKGIPMLVRTYNQCKKIVPISKIIVATDDKKIKDVCDKFKIKVIMTSKRCITGTDRVAEVATKIKKSIQGLQKSI